MSEIEAAEKNVGEAASTVLSLTDEPSFPARFVCFGPFYLDVSRRQLYRNGSRLKLLGKPIRLLKRLLETPNEIVLREELCGRLWSSTPDIVIYANLSTTLNKLRTALGDSASQPIYIETVHGVGYRFMAPIEFSESAPSSQVSLVASSTKPAAFSGLSRVFAWLQRRRLALSSAVTVLATAVFVGFGCSLVWIEGIGAKSLRALVLITMIGAATAVMAFATARLIARSREVVKVTPDKGPTR
jgi:DNA-binding winged helix-turn-helix (wHTH) protein